MATTIDQFTVVVVGRLNPPIHHPTWYEGIGALSREETAAAMKAETVLVHPKASRLTAGGMAISCDENRWSIVTDSEETAQRAVDVAAKVFASLKHTPVRAYGFNFVHHRTTRVKDVTSYFTGLVESLPLGLRVGENVGDGASISYSCKRDNQVLNLQVEPSQIITPAGVFLSVNVHYSAPSTPGPFDLSKLLETGFKEARHADAEQLKSLLTGIAGARETSSHAPT